jgi:hypothetical protein
MSSQQLAGLGQGSRGRQVRRFGIAKLTGALAVIAAVGCKDNPSTAPDVNAVLTSSLQLGHLIVCKVGSDASFEVSVSGGAASTLSLTNGECKDAVVLNAPDDVQVTVTETVPAGTVVDSIVIVKAGPNGTSTEKVTGTNTVTRNINGDFQRTETFYNHKVEQPGDQGCTPGYWKQDQHFDSWPAPYTPNTLFSDVFDDAFPGLTLLQVLQLGGGGLNALGRHTVSALLNSASSGVQFSLTTQEVIDAFNAVFPGGNYEGLKNRFAAANERSCPLN